jgi:hypothetical protein
VLPVIIIVVVAIPILLAAFAAVRRKKVVGENVAGESPAERKEVESEFDAAERYQEEWRQKQHEHPADDSFY